MEVKMKENQKYLHKLYPYTKLVYLLVTSIIAIISPGWIYSYILFAILCVFAATGSDFKTFIKSVLKSVLFLFIMIFILQTLFRTGEHVLFKVWIFTAKLEGVLYAAKLCGILLVIASSFILFFQTTELQDLILAMEKSGISPTVSYVVLSTVQMIPQTKKRSEVIMNAQQARGVETQGNLMTRIKAYIPMLAPLILSSFTGMEERALTLEARAFSLNRKKTNIHEIHEHAYDKRIKAVLYVILVLAVVGRFTIWH